MENRGKQQTAATSAAWTEERRILPQQVTAQTPTNSASGTYSNAQSTFAEKKIHGYYF